MTDNKKVDLIIPKMGESITEAHIGQVFKPDGSYVERDDEILELETDKVNIVLYAPQAGTVSLKVIPDDLVKIDQVVGFVEAGPKPSTEKIESIEEVAKAPEPKIPEGLEKKIEKEVEVEREENRSIKKEETIRQSKEFMIDQIKNDVNKGNQELVKEKITATILDEPLEKRTKMSRMRLAIASKLVEAQSKTAMLTTFNEVDLTEVIALRDLYKEQFLKKHGVKLGFMSFFVKAACSALKEFPLVASFIEGEEIVHKGRLDIGVAVSTEKGLVVPVVRDCDKQDMAAIEKEIETYSKKARDGNLTVDEMRGGVFTITNGGVFGSMLSTPILNFPQSAILGMHKIEKRAMVIHDEIKIRSMMYLALTYDHRIVDGKDAVQFLVHIKNKLETPGRFLLDI